MPEDIKWGNEFRSFQGCCAPASWSCTDSAVNDHYDWTVQRSTFFSRSFVFCRYSFWDPTLGCGSWFIYGRVILQYLYTTIHTYFLFLLKNSAYEILFSFLVVIFIVHVVCLSVWELECLHTAGNGSLLLFSDTFFFSVVWMGVNNVESTYVRKTIHHRLDKNFTLSKFIIWHKNHCNVITSFPSRQFDGSNWEFLRCSEQCYLASYGCQLSE